jgi:DNA-binding XRE family transcriptional regulator
MDIKTKIGLRIKELRTEKELTQEGLAWNAEINRTFMNHIENGRKNLSVESLEKIIAGLGTNLKEFFNSDLFNGKKKSK